MEKITKISCNKNKYIIQTNRHQYILDEFYYQTLFPYVGKEIDDRTCLEMNCFSKAIGVLKKIYPKIFQGSLSKKQVYFQLKEAKLEAVEIQIIMNKFKSENYLKEESFIAYHQEFFERNKGSQAFKMFLKENQIHDAKIEEALAHYEENIDFALAYANSIIKRKVTSSKMIQQQIIFQLKQKGFSDQTIKLVLENINPVNEKENIQKDYIKYKKMYDNPYKLLSKMLQKGYNREDVLEIMECDQDEN